MKKIQILMIAMLAGVCSAQDSSIESQIMQELQPGNTKVATAQTSVEDAVPAAEVAETIVEEKSSSGDDLAVKKSSNSKLAYLLDRQAEKEKRIAEEKALDEVTASWNGMILRDYQLTPVALEKMRLKDVESSTDVSSQFPDVDFPEGSKAVYRPVLDRLYVLNTRKNVARLETLLAALEAPQSTDKAQIEIKTRFVEFSEGALEELGFNWENLTDQKDGNWSLKSGENLFTDSLRTGAEVFTQPETLGSGETRAAGDWTASRLADQFTDAGTLQITGDMGPNVEMLIRALDQTSGTDVLSAPSIVTTAGKKATIQVGQTHYFPADFGVGGSEGNIVHVEYNEFTEKLMGVDLSVTPKLVENGLIEMDLNPKVTELLGWRNYEIAPEDSAYTYYQYRIGLTFEHDPIIARLPIFRHREVKTKVTIQDGSTIGMGGLISEKTEDFSDRVPVLGSIPLVGRLFRSEGERTVKRNLMIFVTAQKVAPNGRISTE